MICVFGSPAVSWVLTAVLLVCGSYHFLQAVRPQQRIDRVNNSLHGLMHVSMVAMVWNFAPSTRLAQIAVFVVAALWFIAQAVARADLTIFCVDGPGRLGCVYHSLTMAGAALMIAMMGFGAAAGHDVVPQGGMSGMHGHHELMTAAPVATGATFDGWPSVAVLPTVFFAAAAVVFIILLLRFRVVKTVRPEAAGSRLFVHPAHSIEALGATVMALMFATMTG